MTRVTVEFGIWILIEIFNSVAFFMETLVTLIAVDDFVFIADVGGEADFAVGLNDAGEF